MKRRAPQLKLRTTTVQSDQNDCDSSCERLGDDASKDLEDGNRMSKIMRQMYAEARAAREAGGERQCASRPRHASGIEQAGDSKDVETRMLGPSGVEPGCIGKVDAGIPWATRIDMARERFMPAPG